MLWDEILIVTVSLNSLLAEDRARIQTVVQLEERYDKKASVLWATAEGGTVARQPAPSSPGGCEGPKCRVED